VIAHLLLRQMFSRNGEMLQAQRESWISYVTGVSGTHIGVSDLLAIPRSWKGAYLGMEWCWASGGRLMGSRFGKGVK